MHDCLLANRGDGLIAAETLQAVAGWPIQSHLVHPPVANIVPAAFIGVNGVRYDERMSRGRAGELFPRGIGVLGLGWPGRAIAERLLLSQPAATTLAVYDADRPSADGVSAGARRAVSPADLAARSQIIVVSLPDLPHIEAQLAGPSGLQAGVHSPTTLVLCSALEPAGVGALALRLRERTAGLLRVVDAPVSGAPEAATDGTLSIMVGSTPADYAYVRPVLDLLGSSVRLGAPGAGQIAHGCSQLVVAATAAALREAVALAAGGGLDPSLVLTALQSGPAASRWLNQSYEALVSNSAIDSHLSPDWGKDLEIARAQAANVGLDLVLSRFLLDQVRRHDTVSEDPVRPGITAPYADQ